MSKQRSIVTKKDKCNKENPYTTISISALNYVVNDNLSAGGLKLWLFLAKNQDGFSMSMWQGNLDSFGLPKSTYKRAWKELEEKGYIKQIYGESYIFNEIPDGVKVNPPTIEKDQSEPIGGVKLNPTWGQSEPITGVKVNPLNITNNITSNNTNNNIINNSTDDSVILLNKYITDNNITIGNSKNDNNINTKKYNSMVEIVTGKNIEVVDRIIKQHINKNNGIINSSIIIGAVTLVNKQYNKTLQIIEEENRALEFRRKAEEKIQEQKILELMFNDGDESVIFDSEEMRYVRI